MIGLILDEYDHLIVQDGPKVKTKENDAAFSANLKGEKGSKRFSGTCFNCGWKGHKSEDCWEEGGGKESKVPKNWKSHGKKRRIPHPT